MNEPSPKSVPEPRKRRRGIYLLPNLFTTAALFAGFYAIVTAMKGDFGSAAVAIFVAMILDGADGRIARMTNTESAFGVQYDSLSDLVSFGLAPSLVVYLWSISTLGKIGWLCAFFFTAATALRLARFNTQVGTADKRYFQGLPCPAGAAVLAGLVWFGTDYDMVSISPWVIAGVTTAVGALMVSNIRYQSFKELDLRGRVPFVAVLVIVVIFALVSLDPPFVLFVVSAGYAISGPLLTLWLIRRRRMERRKAAPNAVQGE
ncbi:MAG: CDP-diacylglycerol--serine O-phosphatidyltransferase [Gammaproteobacteria bacterium]|nr:CDP-diacylglycerol--serine O-phosphatidyltransferase [Gammaproteobacteria bacterium]